MTPEEIRRSNISFMNNHSLEFLIAQIRLVKKYGNREEKHKAFENLFGVFLRLFKKGRGLDTTLAEDLKAELEEGKVKQAKWRAEDEERDQKRREEIAALDNKPSAISKADVKAIGKIKTVNDLLNPKEKPRRKRGRPKKSQGQEGDARHEG